MHWEFWAQLAALCLLINLDFASSQNLYFNGRFPQQKSNDPGFPVRLTWASSSVYVPFQGSGGITVSLSSTSATGSSQIELRIDSKLVESATVNTTAPSTVSVPIMGSGSHLACRDENNGGPVWGSHSQQRVFGWAQVGTNSICMSHWHRSTLEVACTMTQHF